MEKISLFNYEVFYLDYLEGNLNEEDTALLMDFLEKHPECLVDDSILDSQLDEVEHKFQEKHLLKEEDVDAEITNENVDHFLVALTEGVLSPEKAQELNRFVEAQGLQQELKLAEAVYFEADRSIKYQHKESLKQSTRIVLWPYVASAAAVGIIAFLMLWNSPIEEASESPSGIVENAVPAEQTISPVPAETTYLPVADNGSGQKTNVNLNVQEGVTQGGNDESIQDNISTISSNPVRPIVSGLDEKKLAAITKRTYTEESGNNESSSASEDYAAAHFGDMDNPIKPITKLISDKTKTDVDFRSRKASKKKPGGFFIKIGRFEVSRKKH